MLLPRETTWARSFDATLTFIRANQGLLTPGRWPGVQKNQPHIQKVCQPQGRWPGVQNNQPHIQKVCQPPGRWPGVRATVPILLP